MYKIRKYFEKGEVIACDCWTQLTAGKGPAFKRQPHKIVKHTQTIHWQFADELLKCVSPFCWVGG